MDFSKLKSDIEQECVRCFTDIREKYPDEKFCGYSLYSDSDASSIAASINTKKHLKEIVLEDKKENADDAEDKIYYKWNPSEWNQKIDTKHCFIKINETLTDASDNDDIPVNVLRRGVYEACVSALELLYKNGFFEKDDCVVTFSIPGSEEPTDVVKWVKRLNSKKQSDEYEEWVLSWV